MLIITKSLYLLSQKFYPHTQPNECMGLNAYATEMNRKNGSSYGNGKGVIDELNEWECVQVNHHNDIGKVIGEWERKGWRLHTYQATRGRTDVKHYLLFEKGE